MNLFKKAIASLVFSIFSILSSITKGNSGIFYILCPLANTNGVTPLAAIAAAAACLLYLILTFLCHLLKVFNGANILPFLTILPKAAYPDLLVPLPDTLGILATALPVPHDSAECFIPALLFTPWAYLLFLAKFEWTNYTKSFFIRYKMTS